MDDYINWIEIEKAWGGELEMAILSKIYKCAFIIHANGRPNISVSPIIIIHAIVG